MSTSSPLKIDQALHGYDRGHRLLHCSIELDEVSRSQMLVLSDLLSTVELNQDSSYLTAYPLKDAQRFVIARTWLAGPDFRPGSVWTHSLIVDYQTLATVHDISRLPTFLNRPNENELIGYGEPIEGWVPEGGITESTIDPRSAEALALLYDSESSGNVTLPTIDSSKDESLSLQLWRQMWPGMRRDFAFMTVVGDWPSGIEFGCSLRFTRNSGLDAPSLRVKSPIGFNCLLTDLPKQGPTELRAFLGRYVIEHRNPRDAVMPLATLFALKQDAPFEIRLQAYRDLSSELQLPRLSREFIGDELGRIDSASELITLVRTLSGTTYEAEVGETLSILDKFSSKELRALLDASVDSPSGEIGNRVFDSAVQYCSTRALAAAVDDRTRLKVALARPDIAEEVAFWPRLDADKLCIIDSLFATRRFDAEWGWNVFDKSLGVEILARLLAGNEEVSDGILQILLHGTDGQRQVVSNWMFEDGRRFEQLTGALEDPPAKLLPILASTQIRTVRRFDQAKWWTHNLLNVDLPTITLECPSNLLVLGFISAVRAENDISLRLFHKYFTHTIVAATSYHFTSNEDSYLRSELDGAQQYLTTQRILIRSALDRCPISASSVGVFAFTENLKIIELILLELEIRQQTNNLPLLRNSNQLPVRVREQIDSFLEIRNSRWKFPWIWF